VHIPALALESFLGHDVKQLSLRAASGFLSRLEHSSLRHDPLFVEGMRKYVAAVRKVTTSREPALNEHASRRMANTRAHSNAAELALRSALHKLNYRFRVNYKVVPGLRRTADIAFPSLRVAVFVDGCFWHACPVHGTWPKHNAKWWREKIEANRARDLDTNQRLKEHGWTVVRIWEHENAEVVARRLSHLLSSRKGRRSAKSSKA
jgi:DNA mismatch endonuclease (patch repair protein)